MLIISYTVGGYLVTSVLRRGSENRNSKGISGTIGNTLSCYVVRAKTEIQVPIPGTVISDTMDTVQQLFFLEKK